MKKTVFLLIVSALILSGCSLPSKNEGNDASLASPSPSSSSLNVDDETNTSADTDTADKIDIEVSDFIDAPDENPSETADNQKNNNTQNTAANSNTASAKNNTGTKSDVVSIEIDPNKLKKPAQPKQAPAPVENKTNNDTAANPPADTTTNNIDSLQNVSLEAKVICIDAGHGIISKEPVTESMAPDVDIMKPAYSEGTKGSYSSEDTINLAVAMKLKSKLEEHGATVIMTRTDEYNNMTNIERAKYANNANICIKLHADSTAEGGSGITALIPGGKYTQGTWMIPESKRLAASLLKHTASTTQAINRGVYSHNDMTGLNWSCVPVVLFEMGYITNPSDEAKLNTEEYQIKIADGLTLGILEYFS